MVTEYQKKFLEKLSNSDNWPWFSNWEFLQELEDTANEFYNKWTLEGYLASFLIYIQLSEEMLKVLLDSYYFHIQCHLFPNEIKISEYKKLTFWQLIWELDKIMLTSWVLDLIDNCKKLNENRNKVIHKITKNPNLTQIKAITKKWKKDFDNISEIFLSEYDWYRVYFKDESKYMDEKEELLD